MSRVDSFPYESINELNCGLFWFEASMLQMFPYAFSGCDDNVDVGNLLKAVGVLDEHCEDDSETCAFVVYFRKGMHGRAFVDRLNGYLKMAHGGRVNVGVEV